MKLVSCFTFFIVFFYILNNRLWYRESQCRDALLRIALVFRWRLAQLSEMAAISSWRQRQTFAYVPVIPSRPHKPPNRRCARKEAGKCCQKRLKCRASTVTRRNKRGLGLATLQWHFQLRSPTCICLPPVACLFVFPPNFSELWALGSWPSCRCLVRGNWSPGIEPRRVIGLTRPASDRRNC